VTEEIKTMQTQEEVRRGVESGQWADTGVASRSDGTESSRLRFNRYVYENLLGHIEGQIEQCNRMAVRQSNPEASTRLGRKPKAWATRFGCFTPSSLSPRTW
jgi:hypothetical protein